MQKVCLLECITRRLFALYIPNQVHYGCIWYQHQSYCKYNRRNWGTSDDTTYILSSM